jgi:ATP adenylyltransferase
MRLLHALTYCIGKTAGLLQHPDLPFAHFARSFVSDPSSSEMLSIYNELYKAANESVNSFIAANPDQLALHSVDEGDSPISYNLAMTTSGMAILPRRSEGTMLRRDDGSDIGFVALNGTTLGGTMMVSSPTWSQRHVRHALIICLGV